MLIALPLQQRNGYSMFRQCHNFILRLIVCVVTVSLIAAFFTLPLLIRAEAEEETAEIPVTEAAADPADKVVVELPPVELPAQVPTEAPDIPAEEAPAETLLDPAENEPTAPAEPDATEPDEEDADEEDPDMAAEDEPGLHPYDWKRSLPAVNVYGRRMPIFYQEDYDDVIFGTGTIADNGCSITAVAMVASYMTGHLYTPPELADYFGGRSLNNVIRFEDACHTLQLKFTRAQNILVMENALRQGKVVVELVKSPNVFTKSQHFLILTGIDEEDNVTVIDPSKRSLGDAYLKRCLESGIPYRSMVSGYDGAWIFDADSMPEDPFIYYEEPLDRSHPRYPDIHLNSNEIKLLAKLVWVEARGESFEGMQAVAEVVLNRMASASFPNTLNEIVYGKEQFITDQYKDADPCQQQYDAIEQAIYGPNVLPEEVVFYARHALTDHIWGRIGGHVFCYP